MNAILRASLCVSVLGAMALAQQPLGDVARQSRAGRKPVAKVITNDDLPESAFSNNRTASAPDSTDKPAAESEDKKLAAEPDFAQRQKEFRERFAKEQQAMELLKRELDVAQREFGLQTAAYYSDAGSRLRNPQQFEKQRQEYEATITEKQKKSAEATQKLEDLKEEARRAGLPMSTFE